jgi:alpha-glucoside transport system permease protein
MGALFTTLVTMIIVFGGLIALVLGLYSLTRVLPSRWREGVRAWVVLLPALFFLLIGVVVPAFKTIYDSFLDENGKKWVGVKNYREIFAVNDTLQTVINTLTWAVVGTFAVVVLGLTIARFADGMKFEKTAKSATFLPYAVSLVGAGIIWRFVYAGPPFKVGLLNQVAKAIPGLPNSLGGDGERNWVLEPGLGSVKPPVPLPGFNTFLLIVIFVWATTGFAVVVFSAAIKGVPDSLIEAAKVDGATDRQVFYKVVLPYIRATIITVATTTVIAGFKAFDIVAATTGGNFGTSTIANEFDRVRFTQGTIGKGSALAVIIFILVVPVVVINQRSQRRAAQLMGG